MFLLGWQQQERVEFPVTMVEGPDIFPAIYARAEIHHGIPSTVVGFVDSTGSLNSTLNAFSATVSSVPERLDLGVYAIENVLVMVLPDGGNTDLLVMLENDARLRRHPNVIVVTEASSTGGLMVKRFHHPTNKFLFDQIWSRDRPYQISEPSLKGAHLTVSTVPNNPSVDARRLEV